MVAIDGKEWKADIVMCIMEALCRDKHYIGLRKWKTNLSLFVHNGIIIALNQENDSKT